MANLANVRIGACSITFGGVNVGHTKGGVDFSYERNFEDLTVDQYGDTPVDKALTGQNLTVVIRLAEPQVANLNIAMPEGDHVLGGTGERLNLGNDAGYQLRNDAKQLVLHPLNRAASDLTEDVTIYKAVSVETVEIPFHVDDQRVVEVTFQAFVDETFGTGRRLGHIGVTNVS